MPFAAAVLLAGMLAAPGSAAAGAGPDAGSDRWSKLDAAIRSGMAEWEVPGLSIAVIEDGQVAFVRAYGVRELGKPDKVDLDTVMAIGSTTKAMTSALVGMLVDDGRLSWDDPVTKHLPWFQLFDPWVTRELRIRDALTHRVGAGGGLLPAATAFERREMMRRLRFLEPYASFRTRYEYNNVMYSVAGEVAAEVAGKTWEELLSQRLLSPLGMKSAHPTVDTLWPEGTVAACFCCDLAGRKVGIQDARPGTNLVMPHFKRDGRMQPIPWRHYASIGPAGGELAASIKDMAQWVRFLVGKGTLDGKRLLSERSFAEMHTPQNLIREQEAPIFLREESDAHSFAYGLGWRLNVYRGHRMSTHTGNVYGFMAAVGVLPDDGLGVVVLANAERTGLAPSLILTAVDQRLGGPDRNWSARTLAKYETEARKADEAEQRIVAGRQLGTSPPRPLEAYAGSYRNPAYGDARIETTPTGLVFRFPAAQEADLLHWHHDLFRLSLRGPMAYPRFATFRTGADGNVASLEVEGLGQLRETRFGGLEGDPRPLTSPGMSVVIVGGGVIGVCAAYYMMLDGWRVTLLERGEIGEGCSFGNAGLVVPSHVIPLAAPGVWRKGLGFMLRGDSPFRIKPRLDWALIAWLVRFWRSCSAAHVQRSVPTLRALTYESLRLFEELARLPGFDFGYSRTGMLMPFRTRQGWAEALAEARLLREAGVSLRELNGAETEALEPYLKPGVIGGVLFEDDASLVPDAFVKGLASLAASRGAVMLPRTEVTGFEVSSGRVTEVVTTAGSLPADEVVLAAGSATPALGRKLRMRLPIQAGKGYSMTFANASAGPRMPLILGEAKVSITPLAGRVRFSGTLELAGEDASVDSYRAESILRSAAGWVKDVPATNGTRAWSGLRPCTPDGLPLLGRPARYSNVIVAAGHAMLGVSLGPVTGALVADIGAGRSPAIPIRALHPDRFSGGTQ